jgi:hypothetical protein
MSKPLRGLSPTTQVFPVDAVLEAGEGPVFRGAPNTDVIAGPQRSPFLPFALHEERAPMGADPNPGMPGASATDRGQSAPLELPTMVGDGVPAEWRRVDWQTGTRR